MSATAFNPYEAPIETPRPTLGNLGSTATWVLFSFEGRINRRQAWAGSIFMLCATLAGFVALVSLALVASAVGVPDGAVESGITAVWVVCLVVYSWTSLAMRVKRWHDMGKSGWMALINVIPYAGALVEFIATGFVPGDSDLNEYGHPPKGWARSEKVDLSW